VAEVVEKHPSWFKMKIERRELVRQLSPETAVNVLLACWDFLETGEKPNGLSPIENVAFASFMPDVEEAWSRYILRTTNGAKGGRPKRAKSCSTKKNRMVSKKPYGTEEETETEKETEKDSKREFRAALPPTRPRFVPPTVEEVAAYVKQRGSAVDPQGFIDFYAAKGWLIGKAPMRDWKAACRNAEHWERWKDGSVSTRDRVKTAADYEGGDDFFTRENG